MLHTKLLVLGTVHACGYDLAGSRDDLIVATYDGHDQGEILRRIGDADALVVRGARIDRSVIDAATQLRIISRHGVGYDSVDINAAAQRGIPVTITPLANSSSVAEHAMYLLLALAKNARGNDQAVRTGQFESARVSMKPVELGGRTLLIIGFGRIGSRLAPMAQGFGMNVMVYDPYIPRERIEMADCQFVQDLRAVLPEIDAITIHTPLTDETRGMIGEEELALLNPSALIVNTARGGVVCESALFHALQAGTVAGAGLDVFEGEPAPPHLDNSLFTLDNVIVSPHCAGVTAQAAMRMAEHSVQNVLDFLEKKLDPDVVVNGHLMAAAYDSL